MLLDPINVAEHTEHYALYCKNLDLAISSPFLPMESLKPMVQTLGSIPTVTLKNVPGFLSIFVTALYTSKPVDSVETVLDLINRDADLWDLCLDEMLHSSAHEVATVTPVTDDHSGEGKVIGKAASKSLHAKGISSVIWARDEHNPDYRLITINAANSGFQSELSSETGWLTVWRKIFMRMETKDFYFKF